jgi:hypothetical protein
VRDLAERLTGIDDWAEADLRGQHRLPAAGRRAVPQPAGDAGGAPRNGDFVTPTIVGAEEFDFSERDLRYTTAIFDLLANDREFAEHNNRTMNGWLANWVGLTVPAARALQPLWSQPDSKPMRFEDALDRVKSRFGRHRRGPGPGTPEGAGSMTQFKIAESPYKSDNTASNMCGFTLMNNQVGVGGGRGDGRKPNVRVTPLPSMIRVDADRRMDVVYDEVSEALGEEPGYFDAAEFEENMSTHYGRMIHEDDRTIMFANPEDAAEYLGFDLKAGSR